MENQPHTRFLNYLILRMTTFFIIFGLNIWEIVTYCDRLKDEDSSNDYIQAEKDNCDSAAYTLISLIFIGFWIVIDLHFMHILYSVSIRRKTDWLDQGRSSGQNIELALRVDSVHLGRAQNPTNVSPSNIIQGVPIQRPEGNLKIPQAMSPKDMEQLKVKVLDYTRRE